MLSSVQMSRFAIVLGVLVMLIIAMSGMEAGADDSRIVSTASASDATSLQLARVTPPVAQRDDGAARLNSSVPSVKWLQLARPTSSLAQPEAAIVDPGFSGVDVETLQDGNHATSYSLDLDTPHGQTGKLYKPVDENDQNYARVARITSCYEASVGRYQSELRGAFTNNFSASDKFDSAVSHFYAQSVSQQQFGSCSTN